MQWCRGGVSRKGLLSRNWLTVDTIKTACPCRAGRRRTASSGRSSYCGRRGARGRYLTPMWRSTCAGCTSRRCLARSSLASRCFLQPVLSMIGRYRYAVQQEAHALGVRAGAVPRAAVWHPGAPANLTAIVVHGAHVPQIQAAQGALYMCHTSFIQLCGNTVASGAYKPACTTGICTVPPRGRCRGNAVLNSPK